MVKPMRPGGILPPPPRSLEALLQHLPTGPLWIFAYGSLIWEPGFVPAERRIATLPGWHRALRMRSSVYRGTPERPGLVFALLRGGSCRGQVLRLDPQRVHEDLSAVWHREMPLPLYQPRWLPCRTDRGAVAALGFTLACDHTACSPRLDDAAVLEVLANASGLRGRSLDYLVRTEAALRTHGIHDREAARLVRLARDQGLLDGG